MRATAKKGREFKQVRHSSVGGLSRDRTSAGANGKSVKTAPRQSPKHGSVTASSKAVVSKQSDVKVRIKVIKNREGKPKAAKGLAAGVARAKTKVERKLPAASPAKPALATKPTAERRASVDRRSAVRSIERSPDRSGSARTGGRAVPLAPALKPSAILSRSGVLNSRSATAPAAAAPTAPLPLPTGTNTLASLGGADVTPNSNYGKALKFLATLSDYEHRRIVRYSPENFNLDRIRTLLKKLGDPQNKFRSVHVAGTKGKGSTCTMIAAMVQANGYKTGLYTSPHLVDIRERFQINNEMISREDFARLVRTIEPHVVKIKPLPTYFDVLTALAFLYFAEQKVELAVVETGLGGRLDSTNVLNPEVTAITAISYDHMAQLGNTLEKIAGEKAGIFKPGIPAVTCIQTDGVEQVLKAAAEKTGCTLDVTGKTIEFSYRFESSRLAGPHFRLCLTTPQSKFEHLAVPIVGEHQAVNCGLALTVIDKLKTRGLALSDARCIEGLGKSFVPGRMELVSQTPRIIADGAHNAASIDALIKSIGQHIPYDSMVLIFGCCADKDVKGMLEKIASGADKVIFTRVNNIRSAEPEDLAHKYNDMFGKMCQVAPTLEGALSIARRAVTKEDLICITGSFYLVGEAKKLFPKPVTGAAGTTLQHYATAGATA